VKPGDSPGSKLVARITSTDKAFQMPPAGPRLTAEEVGRIRAWIDAGAKVSEGAGVVATRRTSKHWAFQALARPAVPAGANAIDHFVRARLAKEGFTPAPEADRATLLRRLKFDLLGLPVTPEEVAAFVSDTRPDAWERWIDTYLASPHYGERWARPWLDLARYADSDGYEKDTVRPHAWRYRQWVIEALNKDKGFDRFTIAQMAGDLLPEATLEDRVATGFHRMVLTNREAGVDRAEARFEQLVNRTNTVATTWLGLTAGCAQCHDHKYDPFSQKDYYKLFAFFNEADDLDIDAPLAGEMGPYLKALPGYTAAREKLLAEYGIAKLQARWEEKMREAYANPGKDPEFDFWITSMSATVDSAMRLLHQRGAARSARDQRRVTDYFINNPGPEFGRDKDLQAKFKELRAKLGTLNAEFPALTQAYTVTVHPEHPKTHIAVRGDYKAPGIAVQPDVPEVLPAMTRREGEPARLAFARWLVSKENPIVPRVIANRAWQEFFGRGIVKTSEDFGVMGERPTHPELLDWLAAELRDNGWSLKRLHKTIAMSATYRQSSAHRKELAAKDADNALLGRQARLRLPAENIRDAALYVSGLLHPEVGGKSVKPYLPKGVAELGYGNSVKWVETTGPDAYKRGLYIHFQRTTPYPMLINFDEPDSNVACSRRRPSNTPLQALNLLNDPVFQEAARGLAVRVMAEKEATGERLARMFALANGREPEAGERQTLAKYLDRQTGILESEGKRGAELEQAAWTGVARVLLNTDEFITRE
jgi:hypothetical protein